jgi:prevent-host-death family protein
MTMENDMDATMGAGDFKTKCLQILDTVAAQREPLVITKRGKPVAKLVPMPPEVELFGAMAGSVQSETDIISPLDVTWSATK